MKENKNQINGIKKLAVWKAAESKAASVLDVLVRNGTISNVEKNLNLNVILGKITITYYVNLRKVT